MSIAARITLLFFLVAAGGFYFFADWLKDDLVPRYRESTEEPLVDIANILAANVSANMKAGRLDSESLRSTFRQAYTRNPSAQIYQFLKQSIDLRVYLTDRSGKVIFDSDGGRDEGQDYSQWRDVSLTLQGQYGARSSSDNPSEPGRIMYVAAPVRSSTDIVGVLSVGKPMRNANLFIAAAQQKVITGGMLVALGVTLLALVVVVWVTRPLRVLTEYVRNVRDGKSVAVPDFGKNEFGALGAAFEEMREALEGKKYVEKYVQTLTHELKSPLSGIQGAAELLREDLPAEAKSQFLGNIDRETKRLKSLVDKLLNLSALQARRHAPELETVACRALIEECLDVLRVQALAKSQTLSVRAGSEIYLKAERFWLRESILNLVMNAIDFAPRASEIELVLEREGSAAVIRVLDKGAGVPEWASERVFEAFYSLPRPDTGRKSTGLGLALVREVAKLHGGSAALTNRAEGGACAELRIPISE